MRSVKLNICSYYEEWSKYYGDSLYIDFPHYFAIFSCVFCLQNQLLSINEVHDSCSISCLKMLNICNICRMRRTQLISTIINIRKPRNSQKSIGRFATHRITFRLTFHFNSLKIQLHSKRFRLDFVANKTRKSHGNISISITQVLLLLTQNTLPYNTRYIMT